MELDALNICSQTKCLCSGNYHSIWVSLVVTRTIKTFISLCTLIHFCWLFIQDAVTMVQNIQDAEEAAKRLTEEAYKKGSADNITCVVIRFHHSS